MLDGSSDKVFEQWALDMLYNWHINDPVSQKEIDRNNAIFAHQDNRNPFIDNPQYVQDIWQGTLSVDEPNWISDISMIPNPAKGEFISISSTSALNIKVFNLLGELVLEHEFSSDHELLDIRNLSTGIFLIRFDSGDKSVIKKLIRQ